MWEETVKELKTAAKDGKLTKEERAVALEIAKNKAISYAKKEGWNLLTYVAEATIPVIIKNIVDGRKNV